MSKRIRLPHNYAPRSYQADLFRAWEKGCRRGLLIWHRRAGKDKSGLALTSVEAFRYPGVYWHLFPELNQGRKILWDGKDLAGNSFIDAFPKSLVKRKLDQEMKLELRADRGKTSIWQIVGVDNANSLVGTNPRGIVLSEWALIAPFVWDLLRPILRENKGWALFITTPRGRNHAYRMFQMAQNNPSWFVSLKTVDDTLRDAPGEDGSPIITFSDIEQDRREGMSEEMIRQEYYCSFEGSLVGAYYADQMTRAENEGRIGVRPWVPNQPVYTAWDLGVKDAMAVGCFQSLGREWRWINYYENRGGGMTAAMKWLKNQPYIYPQLGHIGPHDINVREATTAQTRKAFALEHGFGFTLVPKMNPGEGIDMVRRAMPAMSFDASNCERLIDCLKAYRKEWDEKKQEFKDTPYHDWASHGADMVRTAVMGFRKPTPLHQYPTHASMDFDPLTYQRPLPREAKTDWDPFS